MNDSSNMAPALSKFIHPVSVAIGVSVLFIGITGIVLYTISKRETVEVDEGEDQGMGFFGIAIYI